MEELLYRCSLPFPFTPLPLLLPSPPLSPPSPGQRSPAPVSSPCRADCVSGQSAAAASCDGTGILASCQQHHNNPEINYYSLSLYDYTSFYVLHRWCILLQSAIPHLTGHAVCAVRTLAARNRRHYNNSEINYLILSLIYHIVCTVVMSP